MDNTVQKLKALHPAIDEILDISGSSALSLGVLYNGKLVHTAHFGHRNAEKCTPPNDDTIHRIASLTKLVTSTAVAKIVHEGQLAWDVPIREYLPSVQLRQDEIGLKATLKDLLANCTGITPANNFVTFQNGVNLVKENETTALATYLSAAKPYGQFVYSIWNYALVENVVKEVTGTSLCDYIEEHIFRPLKMARSSFEPPPAADDNVAWAHCTHDDGTAACRKDWGNGMLNAGCASGGGARSSINDYMIFLQELLAAYNHQKGNNVDTTPGSIFPLTRFVLSPRVGLGSPHRSYIENLAYCLGVYRTKLPGYLSIASPNFYYTLGRKHLLPYGTSLAGTEVFHHSGTSPSNLCAMYFVPLTGSAVVAFTNSQGLMDPVDFVAQMALSILLGEKSPVDFVKMAKLAQAATMDNYRLLERVVAKGRTDAPPSKPLIAYEGDYYNAIHNVVLSVAVAGNGLKVNMQRGKAGFVLSPYDGDTFYWPVNREYETCEKMLWGFMYKDWHLFRFGIDPSGEVETLSWRHDPCLANPEGFRKASIVGKFARL